MSNIKLITLFISLTLASCQKASQLTESGLHSVSVHKISRTNSKAYINLSGLVVSRTNNRYLIEINLPNGITPEVNSGSFLNVSKVYSRSANLKAKVIKISGLKIEAEVVSELHDLRGHNLTFEIPVKSNSLYAVPIASVVSPRGTYSFVFMIKEGVAKAVEVTPIQVHEEHNLLVYAKLNENSLVVTEGLENLLDGDKVKIFESGVK